MWQKFLKGNEWFDWRVVRWTCVPKEWIKLYLKFMGLRELQDCVEKCGALSAKPFAYASPYGRKMWLQKKINIYVCMGDIHFWNYYNFLGFCNGKRLSRFWQSHNSKYDAIHVRIGTKYTTTVTQWKWRWLRARIYPCVRMYCDSK